MTQPAHLVEDPAHLERPGELEALGLQDNAASDAAGELSSGKHRRLAHLAGDELAGADDALRRYRAFGAIDRACGHVLRVDLPGFAGPRSPRSGTNAPATGESGG